MEKKKRYRPDKDGHDRGKYNYFRDKCKLTRPPCAICGLPINYELSHPHPWSFTLDHIIPINRGGTTDEDNLQPAHFRCNRLKGTRTGITLDEVNALRQEQGAPPIRQAPQTPLESIIPFGEQPLRDSIEYKRMKYFDFNRNLPQSVDWKTY